MKMKIYELIDIYLAPGNNYYCDGSATCPVCKKRVLIMQRPAAKSGKIVHDPVGKCPYCGSMLMFPRKPLEKLKEESKKYPSAILELSSAHL